MNNKRKNMDAIDENPKKVKFEIFGEEMLEKEVKLSGNSGRIYLPPDWVGKHVKIIRVD
jgi:putative transposon-encoded protein